MYEEVHEEETLQSDDEIAKKVMINGALTTFEHRCQLEDITIGSRLGGNKDPCPAHG